MSSSASTARQRSPYIGWYAAGIILLVVFVAAAVAWFTFHPW